MSFIVARLKSRTCTHNSTKIALDERYTCTLHGYICPSPHGDGHLCVRQRGRVVDSVASHGDESSLLLKVLDLFALILWKHFGNHIVDSELARDLGWPVVRL